MSFALSKKTIHCPNCQFEGSSEIKGTGLWLGFAGLALMLVGVSIKQPLWVLGLIMLLVAIFKPAKHICPSCKWENPVPADEWNARHPTTD